MLHLDAAAVHKLDVEAFCPSLMYPYLPLYASGSMPTTRAQSESLDVDDEGGAGSPGRAPRTPGAPPRAITTSRVGECRGPSSEGYRAGRRLDCSAVLLTPTPLCWPFRVHTSDEPGSSGNDKYQHRLSRRRRQVILRLNDAGAAPCHSIIAQFQNFHVHTPCGLSCSPATASGSVRSGLRRADRLLLQRMRKSQSGTTLYGDSLIPPPLPPPAEPLHPAVSREHHAADMKHV